MALHKETVTKEMWDLLQKLMKDETLKDFNLVGGTALSLQIGHRLSVDLDLFTTKEFDAEKLFKYLGEQHPVKLRRSFNNTILMDIGGVKVDFITHQYPTLDAIKVVEDVRLLSLKDIGAMKLHAIFQSGTRTKDFVDMYFLLDYHPLNFYLDAYEKKYDGNRSLAAHSLTYYDNIKKDLGVSIISGKENKWTNITNRLDKAKLQPDLVFGKETNIINSKRRGFKR